MGRKENHVWALLWVVCSCGGTAGVVALAHSWFQGLRISPHFLSCASEYGRHVRGLCRQGESQGLTRAKDPSHQRGGEPHSLCHRAAGLSSRPSSGEAGCREHRFGSRSFNSLSLMPLFLNTDDVPCYLRNRRGGWIFFDRAEILIIYEKSCNCSMTLKSFLQILKTLLSSFVNV